MGDTSQMMRDGDWICEACGNHNYASKTSCNSRSCGAAKQVALPYGGGGKSYGGYKGAAPVYAGGKGAALVYGGGKAVAPVYGGGKAAAPVYGGKGAALVYGGSKGLVPYSGSGKNAGLSYGGAKGSSSGVLKEGDWICSACSNHNYASREVCNANSCGAPRPRDEPGHWEFVPAAPVPWPVEPWPIDPWTKGKAGKGCKGSKGYAASFPREVPALGGGVGDWNCPDCGNLNYASKVECNSRTCSTVRPGMK